jgi:CheY-like chemotaxis protein
VDARVSTLRPADRLIVQECLKSCDHDCRVTFTTSVEEALQCLDATHFSFVMLDLRLGWQDGLELVKAMRSNPLLASIPAIALTGMHGQVT